MNESKLQKIYIKEVVKKFYKTCLKEKGNHRLCYQKPIDYNFWRNEIYYYIGEVGLSLKSAIKCAKKVQSVSNESYELYLKVYRMNFI